MNNTDKIKQASKRLGTSPERAIALAKKYYGTTNLSQLKPYQIDKIITWITGTQPTKGAAADRRAGRTQGRYAKNH